MMKPIQRSAITGALLLFATSTAQAQDDVLILDGSVQFDDRLTFDDDSFAFDDDIFGAAFDKETSDEESWLDHFTVKLSQQFFAQVNNHSIELFPNFSIPREDELQNNRLGVNIRYQNPFAAGWLLQASAQAKFYWNDDYEFEANSDHIDTEYRLNELFVQRSFGKHSIKLGRQTVVWGETVGNSVLDVINTSEFRDFTIIDIEDARLNQMMIVWDFFGEDSNFSSFLNLYPEFNPPAVRGSPFFFEPEFNLTDYDRNSELLFEVGTQWRKSFEGSDIAFMAAYLYENQLRYEDPVSAAGSNIGADAIAEKNDFLLLGFSANRALGKLLLNFDLAFSHNVLADSFNFPGTTALTTAVNLRKDQIGTSFGFEYAVSNEQSVSVGIQAQMLLDEDEGLLPGQSLFNDGIYGSWLMRYSNTLMNGDLVLSSTMQGDLKADSLLVMLAADYTINDNWALNGQIISLNAASDSPLLLFDENLHLGVTITYSF